MKDLYEILDVPASTGQEGIKNAYKARARERHPDKPAGSTEAFQELNEAYSILRNPEKRARYDRGESTDDKTPIEKTAAAKLGMLFQQGIVMADDHKNLIDIIRTDVASNNLAMINAIDELNNNIGKFKHVLDRVQYNGDGNDIFTGQIELSISGMNHQIDNLNGEIEVMKVVLVMLNDYECRVEEKEVSFMNSTATSSDIIGSRFYSGYRA